MGALSRKCRNLADGRNLDEVWRWLLDARKVMEYCRRQRSVACDKELTLVYAYLSSDEAIKNAEVSHQKILNCETGASRLDWIRRAVACAGVAKTVQHRQANGQFWVREAFDLHDDFVLSESLTLETLATVLQDASDVAENKDLAVFASRLIVQLFGGDSATDHRVTIPLVLMNQSEAEGTVATLCLHRFAGGSGQLDPCPLTQLGVEVDPQTLLGFRQALELTTAQQRTDLRSMDVQWSIEGTTSITGRSADAAFAVGLHALARGLSIEPGLFVSAGLNADGRLEPVNGIDDAGSLKLHAVRASIGPHPSATVFVARENDLTPDQRSHWASRSVHVVPLEGIGEVVQAFCRQQQYLESFLQSQNDWILAQASERLGRKLGTVEEFTQQTIALRVARGVTSELSDEEKALVLKSDKNEIGSSEDESGGSEDEQVDPRDIESLKEELTWSDYRAFRSNRTILLGDPGFGKTTLMFQAIAEDCTSEKAKISSGEVRPGEACFSVYLAASDLASRVGCEPSSLVTLQPILDAIVQSYGPDAAIQDLIESSVSNGQCQLCIDALDEVTDSTNLEQYLAGLIETHPLTRVILTSRRTGYAGPPFALPKSDQLELLPLTRPQIHEAIRCWFGDTEVARAICRQVDENVQLHDVLRSPILLNLATRQVNNSSDGKIAFPTWRRRSELYAGFVEHALDQIGKADRPKFLQMERLEFKILLRKLALRLWERDPQRSIWDLNTLHREIKRCVGGNHLWGLRRRFPDLLDDLHESGLLVPIQAGDVNSPLIFLHRTIAEYLAGECLAKLFDEDDENVLPFVDKKLWDSSWKQVLLFFAGCLQDPSILLSRLIDDADGVDQDDLLRHRLLFAATCLPELKENPDCANEIAEQTCRLARNDIMLRRSDAIRDALVALLVANPELDGEPFQRVWFTKVIFVERILPEIGTVAECAELWTWLVERLKLATRALDDDRPGASPQVFYLARAVFAVRQSVDLAELIDGDDDHELEWNQVSRILAIADHQTDSRIRIQSNLMRKLLDHVLKSEHARMETAKRILDNFPSLPIEEGQPNLAVEACCQTLNGPDDRGSHRRAIKLLSTQGSAVGASQEFREWILQIPTVAKERDLVRMVEDSRTTLCDGDFIGRLEQAIHQADADKSLVGFRLLLAINANESRRWIEAIHRVLASCASAIEDFESFLAANPSRTVIRIALELLQKQASRAQGLKLTLAFANSIGTEEPQHSRPGRARNFDRHPEVTVQLAWLDQLTAEIQNVTGELPSKQKGFDAPNLLTAFLSSNEVVLTSIGRSVFLLACRFRPSDSLVAWIVDSLCLDATSGQDFKDLIAAGLLRTQPSFQVKVRERLGERVLPDHLVADHRFAFFINKSDEEATEQLLACLDSATAKERAEIVSRVASSTEGLIDARFAKVLLELANSRRVSHRAIACLGISKLADAAVSREFVKDLFIGFARESTPRALTHAACNLARRCPEEFYETTAEIFFNKSNPLRDHAALIVGVLGNTFAKQENLTRIVVSAMDDASMDGVANERTKSRPAREAASVLERLLESSSDECRQAVFDQLVEICKQVPMVGGRTLGATAVASWLIDQLADPNPDRVFVAALILGRRARNRDGMEPPFLIAGCQNRSSFEILLPAEPADRARILQQTKRLAEVSQAHEIRFFRHGNRVIAQTTDALSKVSPEIEKR
ncbi:hypothetical protein [Novipirellula rosea]|uniref:NACHT domain protein n=1 Tax=Novipirellula rosea TaxID=1031540 RepID=A0ABP8NEC1_9BACT